MTGIEIGLLIFGAICFGGSFFIARHLSPSDMDDLKKLTENEIKILVDKKFREEEDSFRKRLDNSVSTKIEDFESKTDAETNRKLLEMGDFSDNVLNSINKSHDEVLFMYNMLNEKQEKVAELTKDLQKAELDLKMVSDNINVMMSKGVSKTAPENIEVKPETKQNEKAKSALEMLGAEDFSEEAEAPKDVILSMKDELEKQLDRGSEQEKADKEKILSLHNEGKSEVEIAKELGIGLGEVKLILGLFK